MREDFSDIKVGDEVGFYPTWNDPYIAKVTKVTPKYFDVDKVRFRKSNGFEAGGDQWHRRLALKVTPEVRRAVSETQEKNSRKALAKELEPMLYKLPLSVLEQIQAIVSEHQEARG